jgi:hypothetical protein
MISKRYKLQQRPCATARLNKLLTYTRNNSLFTSPLATPDSHPNNTSLAMANEQLKQLISQGVAALKAGSKVAAAATDEIQRRPQSPTQAGA